MSQLCLQAPPPLAISVWTGCRWRVSLAEAHFMLICSVFAGATFATGSYQTLLHQHGHWVARSSVPFSAAKPYAPAQSSLRSEAGYGLLASPQMRRSGAAIQHPALPGYRGYGNFPFNRQFASCTSLFPRVLRWGRYVGDATGSVKYVMACNKIGTCTCPCPIRHIPANARTKLLTNGNPKSATARPVSGTPNAQQRRSADTLKTVCAWRGAA